MKTLWFFSYGRITNGKRKPIKYYPIGVDFTNIKKINKSDYVGSFASSSVKKDKEYISHGKNYPKCLLQFKKENNGLHPTQKPIALLEYLIRTYSEENDLVLDNCMGSGSTGVACRNLNRNFIGIEKDKKYFEIACDQIV